MCARNPRFTVSSLTVHRFLIASITVSTKALCDAFCTNSHYAKIGGIKVAELNLLERELLTALDWRLTVSSSPLPNGVAKLIFSVGVLRVPKSYSTTIMSTWHVRTLKVCLQSWRRLVPRPVPNPIPAARHRVGRIVRLIL